MSGIAIQRQLGGNHAGTHTWAGDSAIESNVVCDDGQNVKVFHRLANLCQVSTDAASTSFEFPTPQTATTEFLMKVGIEPVKFAAWTALCAPEDWDLAIEAFVQSREAKLPRRIELTVDQLIDDMQVLGLTKDVAVAVATQCAREGFGHFPLVVVVQEYMKSSVENEYCELFLREPGVCDVLQDADGNFVL